MGGGVAGGLGGALIGSIVPGVGTALGATLGGLAGSGVQNLVGGGGGSSAPVAQPVQTAQGAFQSYTPQAQQTMDYQFQGLQNQLGNLAWSGLGSLPGGVTPTTQLYPQFTNLTQQIAGQNPDVFGAYGPYGNVALGKDLWGLTTEQNIGGGLQNLIQYGLQTGAAGQQMLPGLQAAATNPAIAQAVQNIIGNPYYGQQLGGAQAGADIGAGAASQVPWQSQMLAGLGGQLPGLGAQTAATTGAQVPMLQYLAGQQAGTGAGLAAEAQGLLPGLQQLYGQTVPGLLQAGGQVAGQAQATTPQLQQIGTSGDYLRGQAGNWANVAQQEMAGPAQNIYYSGQALAGQAPGLAQQAAATSAGLPGAQQQILQTGLDPQGALFNQLSQQTRDQANAIAAQSGLAGTPYAAGLANDAMRNFSINWQNQQLQRQATADQTAAALAGQQLAGVTGGANILNQLTQGGGQLGLGALQQQLAGTQAGANILGGLTQQGANIGLGAAQQQLANVLGGAGAYGNLVGQAGQLGGNLVGGQLNALTGAGGLFNQGAQGASALAGQAGTLANMGLQQQIAAAQGAQGLFQGGLNLGQGGAQLAAAAGAWPAAAYNQQQQAALNALQMQNQLAGQGVSNLAALTGQLGVAGQQPIQGIQAAEQIAAQPYNVATQQAQNAIAALQNQQQFANPLLQMPQDVMTNALRYLTLGENAAGLAGNLGAQNFAQNQAQLQGLGALGQLGTSALFGNQGLLGGGGGGLLGRAFGGGMTGFDAAGNPLITTGVDEAGNVIEDFSGGAAGGGLLSGLGSLVGFA